MFFIKINRYIFDRNLKIVATLPDSLLEKHKEDFKPLKFKHANYFLNRLWWETYAQTHTKDELEAAKQTEPYLKEMDIPYRLKRRFKLTKKNDWSKRF